jgi:hypothetical protein
MRAAILMPLMFACTAQIAPDTYYCGPERLCPEGLACNDADNICTVPSAVGAFGCGEIAGVPIQDRPNDDVPADGLDVTNLNSCSLSRELRACLFENDPADWVQFDLAASCGATTLTGRVTYAVAFEPVAIQFAIDDGAPMLVDVECESTSDGAGQTQRCFEVPLAAPAHYAIGVVHSGRENCDGTCSHNRYLLDFRVEPN